MSLGETGPDRVGEVCVGGGLNSFGQNGRAGPLSLLVRDVEDLLRSSLMTSGASTGSIDSDAAWAPRSSIARPLTLGRW